MKIKLLLACIALATLMPTTTMAYDFSIDGIAYYLPDGPEGQFAEVTEGCNTNLTEAIIPSTVKVGYNTYTVCAIRWNAFRGCSKLKTLFVPATITNVDSEAFIYCYLEKIDVSSDNSQYDSRDNCNAIILTASNALVVGCKTTIIPNSVTQIAGQAFVQCYGLTSMVIPDAVTRIGWAAFYDCDRLAEVTIGSSVKSIGASAFFYCTNLNKITSKIVDVENVTMDDDVFEGVPTSTCVLHVPKGTIEAYRNADQWKDFVNIVEDDVPSGLRGDVNDDGVVDGNDLNELINIILGK